MNLLCKVVFQAASAGALLCTVAARAEPDRTSVDQAILESVALLVHARYGDDPYQFNYTPSGTAIVQETGQRALRFVVRPVAGSRCVFRATFETQSGLNIEQLDFEKFDGSHQTVRACGQKGALFESSCSTGLSFKQKPGSFCQYIFSSGVVSLENLSFPDGACRYLAFGPRRETDVPKYVEAFDSVYRKCAASIDRKTKPPEPQSEK